MINIKLKNFQEKAIDFLFDKTTDTNSKPKLIMQSPTGSGKTIILVGYINKYLSIDKNTVFCWFCPGKGDLEEQSKEKMERYCPNLSTGNLFNILNDGFIEGTTYFINWETITKKDNTAIRETERKNLFERIKEAHNKKLKFIVIIDEEHQNNTSKAEDILNSIGGDFEIRVSATPTKNSAGEKYEIDEIDVINEGLITRAMYINYNLKEVSIDNIETETDLLIEKANEMRKKIALAYENENENINPLVLIQFPNLNDSLIEKVEKKLNTLGYSYENKMLASWFSAENNQDKKIHSKKIGKINIGMPGSSDSITNNNAEPAFLLFKQALATGWDCPRAKILVKLRENMNESFEIQTLGRLRRMPKARHYENDLLDCSYLFTFDEKYKMSAINAGAFETQRVFLKAEAKAIKLVKEFRNFDIDYVDEKLIRDKLYNFFKEKYNLVDANLKNRKIFENNQFLFGTKLNRSYLMGRFTTFKQIEIDHKHYEKMEIEVNTHTHGIERQQCIDSIKRSIGLSYEKTRQLLEILFLKDAGNTKYRLLNLSLKEFYAFLINNIDKLKKDFIEFDGMKNAQMKIIENKTESFTIPTEEHYRYIPYTKDLKIIENNVYKEYNTSMIIEGLRSKSERLFERYCEKNENVKFIYKNGDNGQQYLSIIYGTNFEKQRAFYPDYIVQLKDGNIWLIETKGGESYGKDKNIDNQVKNKFIAFKNFSNKHNYNFGFVRDLNDELYLNNREYIDNMNHENWESIEKIF